jgi:hypothetical protein
LAVTSATALLAFFMTEFKPFRKEANMPCFCSAAGAADCATQDPGIQSKVRTDARPCGR